MKRVICDGGPSVKTTNFNSLNYSKANWEGIYQFLLQYNFDSLYTFQDSDTKWLFIKNTILEAVHPFTPHIKCRSHCRPRWFTPKIQHQLNCIRTMRRKARIKPTHNNISTLNAAEQQLLTDMQKAKLSFESSLLQNLLVNPAKVYNYINFLLSSQRVMQIPPSVYLGTNSSSLDEDKAKLFNHYFFSVFTHSSYQLPSLHEVAHITPALDEICFDEHKVYKVLLISQDCNMSAGIDGICPDVLII